MDPQQFTDIKITIKINITFKNLSNKNIIHNNKK